MSKSIWMVLLWLCTLPAVAEVPLADFARIDSYHDAQISPDGAYVAVRIPYGRQWGIGVLDVSTGKVVSKVALTDDRGVGEFVWANSRRLVFNVTRDSGVGERPSGTGEIQGIDFDGNNLVYLIGQHGSRGELGTHLQRLTYHFGASRVLSSLPKDPDHVLIVYDDWNGMDLNSKTETIYRLNIQTGELDQNLAAPMAGYLQFAADRDGFVRFATGVTVDYKVQSFVRSPEKPAWEPFNLHSANSDELSVVGLNPENTVVYLTSYAGAGHRGLVRVDLRTGEQVVLSQDSVSDLTAIVWSFDRHEPIAVQYEVGKPEIRFINTANPSRAILENLQKAFPGQIVKPVSFTEDGHLAVVETFSDRNPGDYYLFDARTLKASYFAGEQEWIDPDQMPERRPIHFPARDGTEIYGYLTLPPGREPKLLPLVVNPHGGPFFVRDHWQWEADAAAIASRGYAVLQVNFRGSEGFGRKFVQQAKQSWDHAMIDDITDGTHWAVSSGIADPRRMCIFGASYGGYAALMSAVREPDLYRCVVDFAGPSDLVTQTRDSDTAVTDQGQSYIRDFVGATEQRLRDASPLSYVDNLKASILIVHGKDDVRVPYSQAKELRAALERRHYPYEWLIKDGEGHGFYARENRIEFYERMIDFFDQLIGPNSPAARASIATLGAVPAASGAAPSAP